MTEVEIELSKVNSLQELITKSSELKRVGYNITEVNIASAKRRKELISVRTDYTRIQKTSFSIHKLSNNVSSIGVSVKKPDGASISFDGTTIIF